MSSPRRVGIGGGSRLARLYEAHAPGGLRLAYLLTGDTDEAQDLVHDAFVKVAARFGDQRHPDNFNAYLRRTMVNLFNSRLRRKRYERAYLARGPEATVAHMPDVETRAHFRAALMQLPVKQRAAVVLRHYEDLSENQVAELLDLSVTAVRSALFRGVEALRRDLGGDR